MSSGHLLISRRSERAQRGAIDCNVLNLAAKLHYRFITYDPLFGQLEVPISIRHVVMLAGPGGFRREVQPRRQHWFLSRKSGFPLRTPAFCSVSKGQRRLGEKEYRAPSVTPGVALRPRTQARLLGLLALMVNFQPVSE